MAVPMAAPIPGLKAVASWLSPWLSQDLQLSPWPVLAGPAHKTHHGLIRVQKTKPAGVQAGCWLQAGWLLS